MPDGLAIHLPPEGLDQLADLVAERVAARLSAAAPSEDRWMTSAEAAAYLAMTATALHKLTSARTVPFSQDRPGGKLYFRRCDLDAWRTGSSPQRRFHAASTSP